MKRPLKYIMDPNEENRHPDYRTLCQVLRELYRNNGSEPRFSTVEGIQALLIMEAYDLAKRMDRKLKEYNKDWLRESDVCEEIDK